MAPTRQVSSGPKTTCRISRRIPYPKRMLGAPAPEEALLTDRKVRAGFCGTGYYLPKNSYPFTLSKIPNNRMLAGSLNENWPVLP